MGFIISYITKLLASEFFKKIAPFIPYIIGAILIIGVYFYGDHKGYQLAKSECKQEEIQRELDAEKIKNKNLQDQYDNSVKVIANLKEEKEKTKVIVKETVKVIHDTVKDNRACDIGKQTIDALNKVRTGK